MYICDACHKSCRRDITHVCDQTCSDCMARHPCVFAEVRFPCEDCNRHFRIRTYFANHKQSTAKRKSVCERKRYSATCGLLVIADGHECNKRYCAHCYRNRDVGHLFYMSPLKDLIPDVCDKILYEFYDIETTKNTRYPDKATIHVPNLVCVQQYCSKCEVVEDCGDCVRCGKRKHSFCDDPVRELLLFLREPRP